MIPKQAIEKAIEGGWLEPTRIITITFNNDTYFLDVRDEDGELVNKYRLAPASTALDPTFWQALGKALGWQYFEEIEGWRYLAHRFYDLILTGQPTDEFWADLLK